MRFPFNRRPAPAAHPDDWVTRLFARFMAEPEPASPTRVIPESSPQPEWPADKGARREAFNAHLREVIDAALIATGKSARAVSMEIVGHDGLIRDIRRGNVPTADKLAALAVALDLDFHFGPAPHRDGGVK